MPHDARLLLQPRRVMARLRRIARGRTTVTTSPDASLSQELDGLRHRMELIEAHLAAREDHFFIPSPPFPPIPLDEFMLYSTCSSADFLHPRYVEICGMLKHPCDWHRKLWEWVFVVHHLLESGVVRPGSKGLVFGVGSERLPALFASLGAEILATDAPSHLGEAEGWVETGQHLSSLAQIRYPEIVDGEVFDANVSFSTCDMRNIPSELVDFDFNWSSCCFEHLGSLKAGMDFVVNAVEKTLRKGGVAVHTTEFNLTSNDQTVEEGSTVIYRRRDIEELIQTAARSRAHREGIQRRAAVALLGLSRRHPSVHEQGPSQAAARALCDHIGWNRRGARRLGMRSHHSTTCQVVTLAAICLRALRRCRADRT